MTLSTYDLSKRWSMSEGTLANWRVKGLGPKFVKIGRRVIYRLKDIENYERKNLK